MSASPFEIVRCIRRDYGTTTDDLRKGAKYCADIASGSSRNPWAENSMANNYAQAATMLTEQAKIQELERETQALIDANRINTNWREAR